MLRATPMKRFWLAVPIEYEEKVIRKIGELGAVHFTREIVLDHVERRESADIQTKFLRLRDRINSALPNAQVEQSAETYAEKPAADLAQISIFTEEIEKELDESLTLKEKATSEIKNFTTLEERLTHLDSNGLKVNEIGNFKHIFVKAGFLNNAQLGKLEAYTGGSSIVYVHKPGRVRESFVVATGLIEDKPFLETTLKLLNFEEFTFSEHINPDPKVASEETKNSISLKEKEIQDIDNQLLKTKAKFKAFETQAATTLQIETAKDSILRTKRRSLIEGWIPAKKVEAFKTGIEEVVPKESIFLKLEDPHPEDKVPAQFENKSILSPFQIFTSLQGVSNYFEINPTPIYMILYFIMFGMMFGDIGGGAIFVILGYLLVRKKTGLFSFSRNTTRKLGEIVISCGISAILFGFLYDEFFLLEVLPFRVLSPLEDATQIIIIALIFGTVQITLALLLNIINRLRRHEVSLAVLGGRGVAGLTFYLSGVVLAVAYIRNLSFDVFLQQSNVIFTLIGLAMLVLIFFYPIIEARITHKKAKTFETLLMGFGEGFEIFLSYITNSVSYIRLAAFAIAHAALALTATILAPMIGTIPSLLIMNVAVFLIEGFAAFIQSIRLMYYEFSTKFFIGEGTSYRPFKTTHKEAKV